MNDDYDTIRQQVEERVKKREKAKEELQGFLMINGFLWFVWLAVWFTGLAVNLIRPAFGVLLVITFIWGFIAISEWLDVVYLSQEREKRFQREVEREIERELAKRAITEKRKRLALSDDGELIEFTDDSEVQSGSKGSIS